MAFPVLMVVVGAVLFVPAGAFADEETGQRLLAEAVQAREAGRLLDAERLLRESLAAHRWTYPAFQLANVLVEMDRPQDAVELYQALQQGEYGEVTGPARDELVAALAQAEQRVAELTLQWGDREALRVRLNGELVAEPDGESELALRLNPGSHIVVLERSGRRSVERQLRLRAGEHQTLNIPFQEESLPWAELRVAADADVLITVPEHGSEHGRLRLELPAGEYQLVASLDGSEERHSLLLSPGELRNLTLERPGAGTDLTWLWIGLGVAAAGAAALTLGLVLTSEPAGNLPIDDVGT